LRDRHGRPTIGCPGAGSPRRVAIAKIVEPKPLVPAHARRDFVRAPERVVHLNN